MTIEMPTKDSINLELRELRALLNQYRNNPEKYAETQTAIEALLRRRNTVIKNTHATPITHDRLAQAAKTFTRLVTRRKDIDD